MKTINSFIDELGKRSDVTIKTIRPGPKGCTAIVATIRDETIMIRLSDHYGFSVILYESTYDTWAGRIYDSKTCKYSFQSTEGDHAAILLNAIMGFCDYTKINTESISKIIRRNRNERTDKF